MNAGWLRRAQPLLGTLVEMAIHLPEGGGGGGSESDGAADTEGHARLDAAFDAVRAVQACLSRFEPHSDLTRFHALPSGERMTIRPATQQVLIAAQTLYDATEGAFDISLGTAPGGWRCSGDQLHKFDAAVRLDLGGIGKGYAVDCAVQLLLDSGCRAGWVNAGGDLRAFGDVDLPVQLRMEPSGGVRPFGTLRDGAFATSHFAPDSRSQLAGMRKGTGSGQTSPVFAHVSVAAPLCLWADALTKIVAASGDTAHPLLARFEASAWLH